MVKSVSSKSSSPSSSYSSSSSRSASPKKKKCKRPIHVKRGTKKSPKTGKYRKAYDRCPNRVTAWAQFVKSAHAVTGKSLKDCMRMPGLKKAYNKYKASHSSADGKIKVNAKAITEMVKGL